MNPILATWNQASPEAAVLEILPCCGSRHWAYALASLRPFVTEEDLLKKSDDVWLHLDPDSWAEAFHSHPRIGERKAPATTTQQSAKWSAQEQSQVSVSTLDIQEEFASANRQYEARFGHIFIVCATGKSAEEMLLTLRHRLSNDDRHELQEAVEQQRQITQLRLRKWLAL